MVITIHDLLWHERRGSDVTTLNPMTYWIKYWAYRVVATAAIKRALKIFVPTETVLNTVQSHYPNQKTKLVVTKEGIAEELLVSARKTNSTNRKKNHLLYVGSLYPHKNVSLVLQALQQLPHFTLEVVGSRNVFQDSFRRQVSELGLTSQVIFSGKLSDDELAKRYAESTLLVQPSFSEGFGLTGLEALAFKTPVVAADTAIFHEVYQDAACYFNPHSREDCVLAITRATEDATWRKLSAASQAVVQQYSWDTLAKKTLDVYLEQLQ